jgi:hypothetical protein
MRDKSKSAELNEGVRTLTTIPDGFVKARARITSRQRTFFLEAALSILSSVGGGMFFASLAYYAFHTVEQGTQAYVYLAGIILSSLVGISIIFLSARKVYQQRKRERNDAIKGVRISESQLFKTLERDFEKIIKPREVHGG